MGTVTFTVTDAAGHAVTAQVAVTVVAPNPPTSAFTLDKVSGTAPLTVVAHQTCTNADWFQFDWKGGTTQGIKHPVADNDISHVYDQPGTYVISLRAWRDSDSAEATTTRTITVSAAPASTVGKLFGGISLPLAQSPATDISRIAADGFGWYRFDVRIATVTPTRGAAFNWSSYDSTFSAAAAAGLKVNAICYMLPQWMNGSTDDKHAPTNPQDYADWCGTAAPHLYAMGVRSMELWNEQNWGFWTPTPDRAAYVTMAILAADAIHAAEPRMLVVSGGLSTADTEYQAGHAVGIDNTYPGCHQTLYEYGRRGLFQHIDAVGIHPYLDGTDPSPTGGSTWCDWAGVSVRNTIAIVDKWAAGGKNTMGRTITVWNTESACPRSTTSEATQATRAGHAFQAFTTWTLADGSPMRSRLGPYFWFTYHDWIPGQPAREASFGLVDPNYVAHQARAAVMTELAKSVTP